MRVREDDVKRGQRSHMAAVTRLMHSLHHTNCRHVREHTIESYWAVHTYQIGGHPLVPHLIEHEERTVKVAAAHAGLAGGRVGKGGADEQG